MIDDEPISDYIKNHPENITSEDISISKIVEKNTELKEKNKELTLLLIIIVVIFIDFLLFPDFKSSGGAIVIGILEIFLIIIISLKMNVKITNAIIRELITIFKRKQTQ